MTDEHAPSERSLRSPSARVQQMYEAHADSLLLFLLGVLRDRGQAEDVLQQTFSKFHQQLQNQPVEKEITAGWLFKVAHNEALQLRRREQRTTRHASGIAWFQQSLHSDLKDALVDQEEGERVRQALGTLSLELRQVVELRVFDDLKFREIAEYLGVPQGTVLTRMTRALRILKQHLQDE